jgi:hypothetical protein
LRAQQSETADPTEAKSERFPYSGFQDIWIEGVLSSIKRLAAG